MLGRVDAAYFRDDVVYVVFRNRLCVLASCVFSLFGSIGLGKLNLKCFIVVGQGFFC